MSSSLDFSLDDLIKSNKNSGSGSFRGARGRGGSGPLRRFPERAGNRLGPYAPAVQAPETPWQHDMFATQAAIVGIPSQPGHAPAIETGTKLYVSNLDYGVSNEDVKELFSEVGDLKRYSIHYDRSGRSKGTAEVVFSRKADAIAAVKRYNNVQLDGKLMKIEIVGTNIVAAPPVLPVVQFPRMNGSSRGGRGGRMGNFRGGNGGRGRKRVGGNSDGRGEKISAADLDAELDKYHSEAVDMEPEV